MKKLLVILFLIYLNPAFSQQTSNPVQIPKIVDEEDVLILNLTSDNWDQLEAGMETKAFRSRGFSFLIMRERMNESGHFGAALGLGFSSQNVHSNSEVVYNSDKSYTSMEPFPDNYDYDLNKLSLNYLDVAFEIRFRTDENKNFQRFKVSVGIKGGILVQSHTKFENSESKYKTYHVANLNDFQYGPTFRIGFAHWGITSYYSLMSIFEDGKGPDLIPYSVGISFTM